MARELVKLDLNDFEENKNDFVDAMGKALEDIGFFAIKNHGIDQELLKGCYNNSEEFFDFDYVKKSSSQVFNKLANSGILVRQMDVYGIKNSLRVTIGNNYENKKFITTLRKIFHV